MPEAPRRLFGRPSELSRGAGTHGGFLFFVVFSCFFSFLGGLGAVGFSAKRRKSKAVFSFFRWLGSRRLGEAEGFPIASTRVEGLAKPPVQLGVLVVLSLWLFLVGER